MNDGDTWTCSGALSGGRRAIFPWLVATNSGVDLAPALADANTYAGCAVQTGGTLISAPN